MKVDIEVAYFFRSEVEAPHTQAIVKILKDLKVIRIRWMTLKTMPLSCLKLMRFLPTLRNRLHEEP